MVALADTSFLFALADSSDRHHPRLPQSAHPTVTASGYFLHHSNRNKFVKFVAIYRPERDFFWACTSSSLAARTSLANAFNFLRRRRTRCSRPHVRKLWFAIPTS